MAKNQLPSPSGRYRPFDHRADGNLPGDALCALILRKSDDVIRDGDKIRTIILEVATDRMEQLRRLVAVPGLRGQACYHVRLKGLRALAE
jgi:acyl transferase domain-containing protein